MNRIDHVAIQVDNIKETLNYFEKNFNCVVDSEYEDWAMISFENIKVALVMPGKHPPHIAFAVKDKSDLDNFGVKISDHRDGTSSCYVPMPSENWVEYVFYPKK